MTFREGVTFHDGDVKVEVSHRTPACPVLITIRKPSGEFLEVFFSPPNAEALARALVPAAREARKSWRPPA